MSTEAQVAANQRNAQHSTGPKSAESKSRICLNAFRHGLAGAFMILADEVREDFDELYDGADKRKTRLDEAALCQRAEDSRKIGFVSQEAKQSRARQQAAAEARKQELHKWKVLSAQAEVDHRVLQNLSLNLQNPEYRLSVSAEHIIAAEKAA